MIRIDQDSLKQSKLDWSTNDIVCNQINSIEKDLLANTN